MYGLINNDHCYLQNEHFLAKNILKNYFENLNLIPIINKNYCQHGYCCKWGWTLKPRLFASLYFSSGRRISIWLFVVNFNFIFSIGQRFRAGRYKISHLQQYLSVSGKLRTQQQLCSQFNTDKKFVKT